MFGVWLTRLPRLMKLAMLGGLDTLMLPALLAGSVLLHAGPNSVADVPAWVYLTCVLVCLVTFYLFGLYRAVVRYIGLDAMLQVVKAVTVAALVLSALAFAARSPVITASTLVIFWGAAILGVGGSRLVARTMIQASLRRKTISNNVVVYGAGDAGRQLVSALERSARFTPVVFVDDDADMQGRQVVGYSVHAPERLSDLVQRHRIGHVLLAIPTLTRARRVEIIASLEPLPVKVLVMPAVSELMMGDSMLTSLREVDVEDLLGRDSVAPDEALIESAVHDKCVMITGAGGSIGSELARQVLRRQPKRLVLFELSEYALYAVEKELIAMRLAGEINCEINALLGDVRDTRHIERVVREERVQTIYHAAAYKHVPLVEQNPIQGVSNNVFGTLAVLKAAIGAGVERFVLVSTDKAVRPTNVMGATKRLAELVVQAYANSQADTALCMVRFGNVLASSGSVVPLFREQIRRGGPVTVTHPDIVRYFMTIPEAASLVVQAGAMGGPGEVFVLDMGEPVKIVDLAQRMIRLSGYSVKSGTNANGDIAIEFTGLRPGEKLYEELLIGADDRTTSHPRIRVANEACLTKDQVDHHLAVLQQAIERNEPCTVRTVLQDTVSGYTASEHFNLMASQPPYLSELHRNVTKLPVTGARQPISAD